MRLLLVPARCDWKIVVITVLSTLLLMVDSYYPLTHHWLGERWWKAVDRSLLYFLAPMLVIVLVFRESPREYGFALGDWKAGLILTAGAMVILSPILWLAARQPAMRQYYAGATTAFPWNVILELWGWEFFFRGWILSGYLRKFGPEALWLQAVPFALAHIGKPAVETLTTIFGGYAFGWVAWRTRSFLYSFLIHCFVSCFVVLVAEGLVG